MATYADHLSATADRKEAEAVEARKAASDMRHAEGRAKPPAERLIYAAFARCPCGFGLAYDPFSEGDDSSPFHGPSAWECAGVLLGTGDKAATHESPLPFAFYEIKSEKQPSAGGATTREPIPPHTERTIP